MQPDLSLSYSSQSRGGMLGVGWSLDGLSAIRRCGRTIKKDGAFSSIEFTDNDPYCLGDQRLIATNGAYGQSGTEYQTEDNSFARIISHGRQGNGPSSFTVEVKSGQTIEYGVTADAKVEAQGKTEVLIWAQNKVTDAAGNYLAVTYQENNANTEYYPTRIDYSGNTNAATSPSASVRFEYVDKPDLGEVYIAGSKVKSTKRLTQIKTYAGEGLVQDYRLVYQVRTGKLALLQSVEQCDENGECLPGTTLSWHEGVQPDLFGGSQTWLGSGYTAGTYGEPDGWGRRSFYSDSFVERDVNGDGFGDLVLKKQRQNLSQDWEISVYLSTGESFGSRQLVGDCPRNCAIGLGDVNGDGIADRIIAARWEVKVELANPGDPDRLLGITDGLGNQTKLVYSRLTDTGIHTLTGSPVYPVRHLRSPTYVVTAVDVEDGLGGTRRAAYKYGGGKVHLHGRGFLGFAWMQTTNEQTGIVTKTDYRQDFPYAGRVSRTEQRLADGTLLGETDVTFAEITSFDGKVHFPYAATSVDESYELDGTYISTTTTQNTYDAYGNALRIIVTTTDGLEQVVDETLSDYTNNTDEWHLGRLTRATVNHTNAQGTLTRTSAFEYNTDGLSSKEIIEPDSAVLRLETSYT
ncbi:toxin TcdB middle/N-terminal domain-containing protein [Candidatus Vondammii sp. HM_W22]|uniref:toxin TcdB middle/N-terminal domain-containing protein n=1 Tax=Candidatus Vondammii sp. HM_W22 TaxID=2687299 RepID=UPI001F1324D3|nr:toxin TcdB middle/N-terminal domain-containing protein [Candidatus Vondammii sp. HM_W22]